jgi:hypothetical protein
MPGIFLFILLFLLFTKDLVAEEGKKGRNERGEQGVKNDMAKRNIF